MKQGVFYRHVVSAADAAKTSPGLLITLEQPKVVTILGQKITDAEAKTPWNGRLRGISATVITAAAYQRTGVLLQLGVLVDPTSYVILPDTGIMGLVNPSIRWTGDIPLPWGAIILSRKPFTATDFIQVSLAMDHGLNGGDHVVS